MTRARFGFVAVSLLIAAGAAHAADDRRFVVPAGSLDRALAALAEQGGIDIGGALAGLGAVAVKGVSGTMTAGDALDRLLAGTGYAAIPVTGGSFRIVRRAAPAAAVPAAVAMLRSRATSSGGTPPRTVPVKAMLSPGDIVVTASKRDVSRLRFPGSVATIDLDDTVAAGSRNAAGVRGLAQTLPILQATDLGPGRDKLFVRGVADSSFDGPTQATASIYFGDVQLGYSGPDPQLNLYDVSRVEVLEGPQGTLYGAGSISGIVRLTPRAPDLHAVAASASAGVTATQGAGTGFDAAAMLNLPIRRDAIAVRAVAYHTLDAGYVDDVRRDRNDVNRTVTSGGRLSLRVAPTDQWSAEGGVVYQTIHTADAQYAERGRPALSRAAALAQPFEDDFLLGRMILSRQWDSGIALTSATGLTDHTRDETFDATQPGAATPRSYATNNRNKMLTEEIRLARAAPGDRGIGWVLGAALLVDNDTTRRTIGPDGTTGTEIIGVINRTTDAALFGEATAALTPRLAVTGGARLTRTRTDGSPTIAARNRDFYSGLTTTRVDPSIAVNWLFAPRLAIFARYQSGFRTGGISVARGVGRIANFKSDTIHVGEAGLRLERSGTTGVSGSAAVSIANWRNIQADLVDRSGLPYSTNIGNGRLVGFEAMGDWMPFAGLHAGVAMFLNRSRLTEPVTALAQAVDSPLPDIPRFAATATLGYRWADGRGGRFGIEGTLRRTGRSQLGTGALLDVTQGDYTNDTIAADWSRGRLGLSATLDNVANRTGNRFALGNPFGLPARNQYTPLRPRNLRIGMTFAW